MKIFILMTVFLYLLVDKIGDLLAKYKDSQLHKKWKNEEYKLQGINNTINNIFRAPHQPFEYDCNGLASQDSLDLVHDDQYHICRPSVKIIDDFYTVGKFLRRIKIHDEIEKYGSIKNPRSKIIMKNNNYCKGISNITWKNENIIFDEK